MLRLPFDALPLGDFERDVFCRVVSNRASKSERVDDPLNANIVWIDSAFSHRDNAEMKSFWMAFFIALLFQCWTDRIAFQLGSFPGTLMRKINSIV